MTGLSDDVIKALLADEAQRKSGGTRGPKIDPTLDRTIPTWYKLNHHMCDVNCEHRLHDGNPNKQPCWNPECVDTRPITDGGRRIVVAIKVAGKNDHYICRYCFLSGYLLEVK